MSQISYCGKNVDARLKSTMETPRSDISDVLATTRYVHPAPYGVVGPPPSPGMTVTSTTSAEAVGATPVATAAQTTTANDATRVVRDSAIPKGRLQPPRVFTRPRKPTHQRRGHRGAERSQCNSRRATRIKPTHKTRKSSVTLSIPSLPLSNLRLSLDREQFLGPEQNFHQLGRQTLELERSSRDTSHGGHF